MRLEGKATQRKRVVAQEGGKDGGGGEDEREGTTTTRVCSRREFTYAREALFTEDNRGVGLEIRTNLSDLRALA